MKKAGHPERQSFTLSTEMLAQINEEASRLDRTPSWLIRKALQEYFEKKSAESSNA